MLPLRCCAFLHVLLALSCLQGADALAEAATSKTGRMHLRSGGVVGVDKDTSAAAAQGPAPAPAPAAAPAPGPAPGPAEALATTISADVPAGASTIEVASTDGFGVGDTIFIGNVSSGEVETKAIIGFGSIILDSPLAKAYPAGTAVTAASSLTGPLPTTTKAANTLVVNNPMAETVEEMDEMVEAEKEVLNPLDPLSILKEQLSANVWLQEELEEKQNSLKEEVYRAKLANDVEAVARETTPGVAEMLGDMRRQMHSLAAPFYEKAVEDQLKDLKTREKSLLEQIEAEEDTPSTTTPPPVLKKEAEKVEVQPEPEEKETSEEKKRLYVICFILMLGMLAICAVLAMRRRRQDNTA